MLGPTSTCAKNTAEINKGYLFIYLFLFLIRILRILRMLMRILRILRTHPPQKRGNRGASFTTHLPVGLCKEAKPLIKFAYPD